jgi:hypothetical protein
MESRKAATGLECVKLHIEREIMFILLLMQCAKFHIDREIGARRV